MATGSNHLTEDQLLCSICLDVFTDPVTVPCGHNFCKKCLTEFWDSNDKNQCPCCNEPFSTRPELQVDNVMAERAAQVRRSAEEKTCSSSEQHVQCDVCTGNKQEAVKSCLVCLTSYCETHLELHQNMTVRFKHNLTEPLKNLEDRMCKNHQRPLEMFCKTDKKCVCQSCTETDHKKHQVVPLVEEYDEKKKELEEMEADVQQLILERQMKIKAIKQSVKLSEEDAEKVNSAGTEAFAALIKSVETSLAQFIETIEETQSKREKMAEGFIKELEEEISALMRDSSNVQELSNIKDPLQFLQSYGVLNPDVDYEDWSEVRVPSSHKMTAKRSVATLVEALSEEMNNLFNITELKRVQQYAADVTLDPETANNSLILSDDGKQVHYGDIRLILPDNPKRLANIAVLGKQGFSSGKVYYEVQVEKSNNWELGVVRESVARNKCVTPKSKDGFWTLSLSNGNKYGVSASGNIHLDTKPQKVGVFVSYEEALVSFYDADSAEPIYSFTDCKFNVKVHPYLNPGYCSQTKPSPLIICPVGAE